jgi:plasmid stabilization system protein ParE
MKRYRVIITGPAMRDGQAAADWIARRSPLNAQRWFDALLDKIDTLDMMPTAHPVARDAGFFDTREPVRQMTFGNYRVLFELRDDTVFVLRVLHAARRDLTEE